MTAARRAALLLTIAALVAPVAAVAAAASAEAPQATGTWTYVDLTASERAAIQADLAQVVPAAQPILERLAGLVQFDDEVSRCRAGAASCSYPGQGADGRWGIHLDEQTTSASYPSNRFLVFHEIGHAAWVLELGAAGRHTFVDAVRVALRGRPCRDGLDRPCAVIGEIFADEFARYVGGFKVSMSDYWTPPLLDAQTFGALIGGA